jgi:hypothetical protein
MHVYMYILRTLQSPKLLNYVVKVTDPQQRRDEIVSLLCPRLCLVPFAFDIPLFLLVFWNVVDR